MAADRVVLVFRFQHHPGKVFLSGTREVGDGRRGILPRLEPTFDDEIQRAQRFSPEQGVAFREFWRSQAKDCWLEDREGNGPLFERNDSPAGPPIEPTAPHASRFVPLTGGGVDGLGYEVRYNPLRGWYCRADMIPSMREASADRETLWGDSPETVAQKILDMWTLAVAVPFQDPQAAQRAEEARQQAAKQASQLSPGIRVRPGGR